MLCDGNTFNYGYIGQRATGPKAGDYLVVGPGWKGKTPAGIKKVFHSTTQFSLVAYRTQLFNPQDMPNVVKVQSGYKARPLSAYLKKPAPPPRRRSIFPRSTTTWRRPNFGSTWRSQCLSRRQVRKSLRFASSSKNLPQR